MVTALKMSDSTNKKGKKRQSLHLNGKKSKKCMSVKGIRSPFISKATLNVLKEKYIKLAVVPASSCGRMWSSRGVQFNKCSFKFAFVVDLSPAIGEADLGP